MLGLTLCLSAELSCVLRWPGIAFRASVGHKPLGQGGRAFTACEPLHTRAVWLRRHALCTAGEEGLPYLLTLFFMIWKADTS